MRIGELMALTPADIDFEEGCIYIPKSFQRLRTKDVITPPKQAEAAQKLEEISL